MKIFSDVCNCLSLQQIWEIHTFLFVLLCFPFKRYVKNHGAQQFIYPLVIFKYSQVKLLGASEYIQLFVPQSGAHNAQRGSQTSRTKTFVAMTSLTENGLLYHLELKVLVVLEPQNVTICNRNPREGSSIKNSIICLLKLVILPSGRIYMHYI